MPSRQEPRFLQPTKWTSSQLAADLTIAADAFRRERMEEPLEEYSETFEQARDAIEEFLEETVDLSQLAQHAGTILTDRAKLESFRYLAGPPISKDDLKTLVDSSVSAAALRRNPKIVVQLLETIHSGLDRHRFPWVIERREPTNEERYAAIIASAALVATQRVATSRRNEGKRLQEEGVRKTLGAGGLQEFPVTGGIPTLHQAPPPGHFCPNETDFGGRKADLFVRLWDGRAMPIECKVSNSSTNSIKRLNNDAAAKAGAWITDFGIRQVVPVAVLSGVYKLKNLEDAQARGLTLYWAHRLDDLTKWIANTAS